MVVHPLTIEEEATIEKLRKANGVDLQKFSDGYLLRWLRFNNGDFESTDSALRKHVVFRKAWALDDLQHSWKQPEVLQKFCGYGWAGPDRDGSPVFLSLFGNMDVDGLMRSCQSQEYIRFSLIPMEAGLMKCEEMARKSGKPYEQILAVFDMDNMTSSHYSAKAFTNSFLTVLSIFQEHYPLLMKKILLIRAPTMAQYAYKMLTPFLSEATQEVIELPGDDWQDVILDRIDAKFWPQYWGGEMVDIDGNPKCPSKIRFGLGPIPESYYVDGEELLDGCHDATVYAGDKHLIEIDVETTGSQIRWCYMTRSEDIGYAIYYDVDGNSQDTALMDVVYPYVRLECSAVPVTGSIKCERVGKYIVEFDNYYSWFSAKELRYKVDLIES